MMEETNSLLESDIGMLSRMFVVDHTDVGDAAEVVRRVRKLPQLQEIQADFELIFLGGAASQSNEDDIISPVQYLLELYRQVHLADNDRQSVLTQDDQLIALQLCMAQYNKQKYDDFDVDASEVLQLSHQLYQHKLHQSSSPITTTQSTFEAVLDLYNTFCVQCNVVDILDVFHKVKAWFSSSGEEDLRKKCQYVALQCPRNDLEVELLKLLSPGDTYHQVTMGDADSLDGCEGISCQEQSLDQLIPKAVVSTSSSASSPPSMSTSEMLARQLFISYLTLLVNSRNEISLARCLSLTTEDLNHDGFTALKNEAKLKNMPMFQTAVSYVTKIRLGGKSYAPQLLDSSMAAHVKGLSDFVTAIQKLQTLVEEIPDTRTAVMKVIGSIRNSLSKCKLQTLKKTSIESMAEQLKQEIDRLMGVWKGPLVESPPRKIQGQGRIVFGLKTIRLLQGMLDREAGRTLTIRPVQVLTDCFTTQTQKTPMRVPSLLSQFRSPEVIDPLSPEYQSLRDRLSFSQKDATPAGPKRYQSDMAWAGPAVPTVKCVDDSAEIFMSPVQRRQAPSKRGGLWAVSPEGGSHRSRLISPNSEEVSDICPKIASSKLSVRTDNDFGCSDTPKKGRTIFRNLPKDSALDQENMHNENDTVVVAKVQEKSKKRKAKKALGDESSSQAAKKAKKPKVTKKKVIALGKGQKTLNQFFRV